MRKYNKMSIDSSPNPTEIYRKTLIPLLEENGFEVMGRVDTNADHSLYTTQHRFVRQTPLRPQFWEQNVLPEIKVVGIPMTQHFLIIHGMIKINGFEDCVKFKLKTNDSIEIIRDKLLNEFVVKLIELLSVSINDLPLELKFRILALLPIESLFRMALVSSLWRDITLDDQLWRILVKQHFPDFYCRGINGENWKLLFKEAFLNYKLSERRKSWASRGLPSSMVFPALPPSPPLLPIMGPPFMPMLPPPPAFFRDLVPEEVRNAFPGFHRNNSISRSFPFGSAPNFDI